MAKSEIPPREALYPVPVVLVTCIDRDNDRGNAIAIAWCGTVASNPPQLSISIRPSRRSHGLIMKERKFIVNIPSVDIIKKTDLCGVVSGNVADKFKMCSFTAIPGPKTSVPMIKECPVNIECILRETIRLGSHDMFIGEIVAVHIDSDILDDKKKIDYLKARPFVYNGGEYWDLGKMVGHYGYSQKKKS